MAGITLDTGALIAFERRDRHMMSLLKAASQDDKIITIPTVAIAESYRGTNKRLLQTLLDAAIVEPLSEQLARSAGEAQAKVRGATTIDAVIAASADQRGDHLVTSDPRDMQSLRVHFRNLRVVAL